MIGILFLKDCEDSLQGARPADMPQIEWEKLNKKVVASIKLALSDDILNDVKGLRIAYEVWQKLKSTHENTTPVNQVHLMCKLVNMRLDETKSALEHLSMFFGVLNQL